MKMNYSALALGAATACFLFGFFLMGLRKVTKGRYVRKDVLFACCLVLFLVLGAVSMGLHTNFSTPAIFIVMLPLLFAKRKSRKFSQWLETKVSE